MRFLSVLILVLMAIACVGNDPAVVTNDGPTATPIATRYPEATMQVAVSTARAHANAQPDTNRNANSDCSAGTHSRPA